MSSPPSSQKRFFTTATAANDLKPAYTTFQAGRKHFSCLHHAR